MLRDAMARATYRRRPDGVCEIVWPWRPPRAAVVAFKASAACAAGFALLVAGALFFTMCIALTVPITAAVAIAFTMVVVPGALRRALKARSAPVPAGAGGTARKAGA
jgi:acyl-CoA reductase-like NAD-dependent aldehyde dehydrogenase